MQDISELKFNINLVSTSFIDRVKRFNIELKSNVYLKIKNENVQIVRGKDADRHFYCDLDLLNCRNECFLSPLFLTISSRGHFFFKQFFLYLVKFFNN